MAVRVGIDLRCLPPDGGSGAGVSHAARELCTRLTKDPSFEWVAYIPHDASWSACQYVMLDSRSGSALRKGLRQRHCDMLFVPSGSIAPFIRIPSLPWVHDLIIFEHPEWFPQTWLKRLVTKALFLHGLRKAPAIFAVSEYTKKKILGRINKRAEKVIVTYEGGDSELAAIGKSIEAKKNYARQRMAEKYGFKNKFILSVGTIEPRKNLAMLIRAWQKSYEAHKKDLVIVGNVGWMYGDVIDQIKSLPHEAKYHIHLIREAGDNSKRNLLLAADTVCVPSLDEGFGLVALEAIQAGTRVIASNAGALPEVVGENGILLDPEDEKAWANALSDLSAASHRNIDPELTWGKVTEKVILGLRKYGLPSVRRKKK